MRQISLAGYLTGIASAVGAIATPAWAIPPVAAASSPRLHGTLSFDLPPLAAPALAPRPSPPTRPSPQREAQSRPQSSTLLSFAAPPAAPAALPTHTPDPLKTAHPLTQHPQTEQLFWGESDSLVARAVGSAEGTRTARGDRTWAYYGHRDPGNGAWNLGSFSYQHGANSPSEADRKQLQRLRRQSEQLHQLAQQHGLNLSLSELLNGIDLANQAPLAALDRGYIDWLAEARQLALAEAEGILWARTWSYWDPDLNRWNAPGLGNSWLSISADQHRRQQAISAAIGQDLGTGLGRSEGSRQP